MTDTDRMVVWLRKAMDAARADAEAAHAADPAPWSADVSEMGSPERPRPGAPGAAAGMIRDVRGDDLWECEGAETLCMTSASAKHAVRHDPAAVLRRIAADRKMLEWCTEVIGKTDLSNYEEFGSLRDHPEALAVTLAVETIRNLAEGYGWTEETT